MDKRSCHNNNPNKIYGVAVIVKNEDQTPITVAVLCRDEM